jgi:molybdate-binding protein
MLNLRFGTATPEIAEGLAESKVRFVNRAHDSGTRLLFDQLLVLHGIDEMRIAAAQQSEFCHAAFAAYAASGMADVSFGVEAAGRQFGPDFICLLTKDYFFVCRHAFFGRPSRSARTGCHERPKISQSDCGFARYRATNTGAVHAVKELLNQAGSRLRDDCRPGKRSTLIYSSI